MCGTTALQQWKTPLRSISTTRRHSAGSVSTTVALAPAMPALQIRISTPPISAIVRAVAELTRSQSETSVSTIASLPRPPSSSQARWPSARSMSQIVTWAPESRKRSTMARPMPCAPPVTMARLPVRS